eukprot:NODE_4966_length_541_cov_299.406504_g3645_i0.p3 GENE.NODE_4966_length_541_cov_299.406504_g3645_i0~~NODE_4966_length_541_cov_299.406504_g3645_i0.p3  ORF type:complete len:104 (-),score=15.29 NODE_4966_length_541_cov_299.406504_g3645_i0:4-315(-)
MRVCASARLLRDVSASFYYISQPFLCVFAAPSSSTVSYSAPSPHHHHHWHLVYVCLQHSVHILPVSLFVGCFVKSRKNGLSVFACLCTALIRKKKKKKKKTLR